MSEENKIVIPGFAQDMEGKVYSLVVEQAGEKISALPDALVKEVQSVAFSVFASLQQSFSLEELTQSKLSLEGRTVTLTSLNAAQRIRNISEKLLVPHQTLQDQTQQRVSALCLSKIRTVFEAFNSISELISHHEYVHISSEVRLSLPPLFLKRQDSKGKISALKAQGDQKSKGIEKDNKGGRAFLEAPEEKTFLSSKKKSLEPTFQTPELKEEFESFSEEQKSLFIRFIQPTEGPLLEVTAEHLKAFQAIQAL